MTAKVVARIKKWKYDPEKFFVDVLGFEPYDPDAVDVSEDGLAVTKKRITKQQHEALALLGLLVLAKKKKELGKKLTPEEAKIVDKFGISIRSGKGTGKTAFLAGAMLWFLVCWKQSRIVATAGKKDQIKDVLWNEAVKWISRSDKKCPGMLDNFLEVQGDKILVKTKKNRGKRWYAVARTASRSASKEEQALTLQGNHDQHMMLIADEASGVPEPVFQALDQTMTDPVNFMIVTFNPNRNSGFAYNTHNKDRNLWIPLHWNAEDCENVSKESIKRMADKYGVDSNAYRIAVKGEFPRGETDCVIPLEFVMAAVDRTLTVNEDCKRFDAMDAAGPGKDECVIMGRTGPVTRMDDIKVVNEEDTMKVAYAFAAWIIENRPDAYGLDVGGLGLPIRDRMREIPRVSSPKSFDFNGSANNKEKYHRWADEAWFIVREKFERGEIDIPEHDELIMELTSRKYTEPNGKKKVESKKDLRARGLTSPNFADAFVMLHAGFKDVYYNSEINENEDDSDYSYLWGEFENSMSYMGA